MNMEQAGIHPDSRSDQHLFKCYPLQNAPLLLLNQARDIMRYGPLAPYMSLEKERFNADVPFFNIEACRGPDWPYNHLPLHPKSAFCSPVIPAVSELHQNNQYCQPLTFLESTSVPLDRQEWMRRSFIPSRKEPLSTVYQNGVNSDPLRSNIAKTFSHPEIYGTSNSTQLVLTQLQCNNDVCCMRHANRYLQNVHPYKTVDNNPAWMPVVTSSKVNWPPSHFSLDGKNSKGNDVQSSFHNSPSSRHEKSPANNYTHVSVVINKAEEPLNLIVNSSQSSNQTLPISSFSSSISISPSLSTSVSSSSSNHLLSVSSRSECPPIYSVHSHKNNNQRHSTLSSRSCSHEHCECYSSTARNYSLDSDHNKQVHNDNPVRNSKYKVYHSSSNSNKITDSSSKCDRFSEVNQSATCDRIVRSVKVAKDPIDVRNRAFHQTVPSRNFERGFEDINTLNQEQPGDYNHPLNSAKENGGFSRFHPSDVRISETQDNLRPSLRSSAVEEDIVAERISRNPTVTMAHGHERIVTRIQESTKRCLNQYQTESASDYDIRSVTNLGLQRNSSASISSVDSVNAAISSHAGFKDAQEFSTLKNATLLNVQRERNDLYARQTELLTAERNEKNALRATDVSNATEKQCSTCTISEATTMQQNDMRVLNQSFINTSRQSNLNRHNTSYPSFKIRPVRVLIGTSQNDVNPHISTSERNISEKSRSSLNQLYPIQQPEHSLIDNHRKESHIAATVPLPGIQDKELKRLEEQRIKTAAHCVPKNANPSEFSPINVTDSNNRINGELEEKEYYYDLNTRDVVPYSSYLPTNSDGVNLYTTEKDLPASDHTANTFPCQPGNIPYQPYEPRSFFASTTSGESGCNQTPEEKDKSPTQLQEDQSHYTVLRRPDPDKRQNHSTPMTLLGSQAKDSMLATTDGNSQAYSVPSNACNNRKHKLQGYNNNREELVAYNTHRHDKTVNDNNVSSHENFINCEDANTKNNSYNVWSNKNPDPAQTMQLGISNHAEQELLSNNDNVGFEPPESVPLQNQDKSPFPCSETRSESGTERSTPTDCSDDENISITNESEDDANLSRTPTSLPAPLTTSGDKSATSIEASNTNAKNSAPTVQFGSSETTNDSLDSFSQCVYCEKSFTSKELLQEHLKTHMVSTPYQCSHCSLGFVSKSRLQRHVQLHMNAKPYKCEECKNLFSTVTAFHRHLHSKKHSGKNLFKCKECGLSFINETYVNLHYKTHTGEHPFQCEQCGNIFACKNNLKNHIMTHTGEKPYQCVHCAKRFVTNFSLKVHIRTHTKEYPYQCNICSKRFLCSSNMASHLRTHTGEKRHQCYKCGKFLSSWSGLQGHQRTHTKECPFSCDLCGKSFSSKFSLRIHQRIHSGENPHKCKYCDKCFSNSSNLQRHLRTHTGEKPYQCTYCGKTFCSSTYLKSHIRTHTGEKPHTCKFCGKGFSNTSCFKQHVKKHEKL